MSSECRPRRHGWDPAVPCVSCGGCGAKEVGLQASGGRTDATRRASVSFNNSLDDAAPPSSAALPLLPRLYNDAMGVGAYALDGPVRWGRDGRRVQELNKWTALAWVVSAPARLCESCGSVGAGGGVLQAKA